MQIPKPAERVHSVPEDVWSVFTPLALATKSVNLGQGFPSFGPPEFLRKYVQEALENDGANQYAHPQGLPELRSEMAQYYAPLFERTSLDPNEETMIGAGANEAIYSTMLAFLDPGDEVILLEPFFDQYVPNITLNLATPKYVRLEAPDFVITAAMLEAAVTERTKMILVNTPHNPTGKVFRREELAMIGDFAERHNLVILADEAYDHLTFDGLDHTRIATLPRMWDRTITIGSFGKLFSCTGWRAGWAIGPSHLIKPLVTAHTRVVFCCNRPCQEGLARALRDIRTGASNYIAELRDSHTRRRDVLVSGLKELGMRFAPVNGGYFVLVNMDNINVPEIPEGLIKNPATLSLLKQKRDWWICYWLTIELGVTAIPQSAFYSGKEGSSWIRLCFCKHEELLHEAIRRLQGLKRFMKA